MSASNPRIQIAHLPDIVARFAPDANPARHIHDATNSIPALLDEWVRWSA